MPTINTTFQYEFFQGTLYWKVNNNIMFGTEQVAIAYDPENGTIFKHGSPDNVKAYLRTPNGLKICQTFPVRTITIDACAEAAGWLNEVINTSGLVKVRAEALLAAIQQGNEAATQT